jgi:hypothetical protein
MNEEMGPAGLLRAAARLVERAQAQLDTTQTLRCAHCGSRRFNDIAQARVADRIAETPRKLAEAADALDGK